MDELFVFNEVKGIPPFESRISDPALFWTERMDVLQMNIGLTCNLACKHCHLQCGPARKEQMDRETMEDCLQVYQTQGFKTIDITGGAPEMNPHFRWLIEKATEICQHVIVRTNLVIMLEKGYQDLPQFYAEHGVELVCSLPHYREKTTNRQRGDDVYARSIEVLKQLNDLGYGKEPELVINLVYNPTGAFFPPAQAAITEEYRAYLGNHYGIVFNELFTITNNPIGRFGAFLKRSGNLDSYMNKLCAAFNAATLPGMMCRYQMSVGWDGTVYDCDFNQALGIPVSGGQTVSDLKDKPFEPRRICFNRHCYACTAGQGSSCGGATE